MDLNTKLAGLDDTHLYLLLQQVGGVVGHPKDNENFFFWYDLFAEVDKEINKRLASELFDEKEA